MHRLVIMRLLTVSHFESFFDVSSFGISFQSKFVLILAVTFVCVCDSLWSGVILLRIFLPVIDEDEYTG